MPKGIDMSSNIAGYYRYLGSTSDDRVTCDQCGDMAEIALELNGKSAEFLCGVHGQTMFSIFGDSIAKVDVCDGCHRLKAVNSVSIMGESRLLCWKCESPT